MSDTFATRAIAVWRDEYGSSYRWGQATKDNRRSRILARIDRYGINPPANDTLRIFRGPDRFAQAEAYQESLIETDEFVVTD